MTRPKVLQVCGSLAYGGVQAVVRDCCEALWEGGYEVDVCLASEGIDRLAQGGRLLDLGSRIHTCHMGIPPYGIAKRFGPILTEGRYSVVHAHLGCLSGIALSIASAQGVPVRIAHHHMSDPGSRVPWRRIYRAWMETVTARTATAYAACSQAALDVALRRVRAGTVDSAVIYNAVRTEHLHAQADRAAARNELGIQPYAPVVGWVGRMSAEKNLSAFVRVARKVLAKVHDARFVLVGDGSERPRLQRLIDQMGLSSEFHLVGPSVAVGYWLSALDLFLLPSPDEGLGIAVIEAQAMGLPVVGYAVPGCLRLRRIVRYWPLCTMRAPRSSANSSAHGTSAGASCSGVTRATASGARPSAPRSSPRPYWTGYSTTRRRSASGATATGSKAARGPASSPRQDRAHKPTPRRPTEQFSTGATGTSPLALTPAATVSSCSRGTQA